ncbi:MAG: deoxyribose-phosphate aldolase [Planctomycetota bacterium]
MSDSIPTDPTAIAGMIDHALLKPSMTAEEMDAGCAVAAEHGFASVCILPYAVRRAAELLHGTGVLASTVIGFPNGAHSTATKVAEAREALRDGAVELDVVVNRSAVRSGRWEYVSDELRSLIQPTHEAEAKVKVIFETCDLSDDEIRRLCEVCGEVGADWVKTSTGFGSAGATEHHVKLMREASPDAVQVKASGGVRDLATLLRYRELGVTRIGTSNGASIVGEARGATPAGVTSAY